MNNKYDSYSFRLILKQNQKFQDKEFFTNDYLRSIHFDAHIPFDRYEKKRLTEIFYDNR
jgi:hypothetical protein